MLILYIFIKKYKTNFYDEYNCLNLLKSSFSG